MFNHLTIPGKRRSQTSRYARSGNMTRREMLALSTAALAGACSGWNTQDGKYRYRFSRNIARPNIVFYLSDALRADAIGVYNSSSVITPFIDAFSRESIVFERCFSQSTWTKPAMASLFTGLLPGVHQAVMSEWRDDPSAGLQILKDEFITLAEKLQESGYATAFFQSNPNAGEELGFRQGFGHYEYEPMQYSKDKIHDVLGWLDDNAGQTPFFLFIHELSPHGPYRPQDDVCKILYGWEKREALDALPASDQEIIAKYERHYTEGNGRESLPDLTKEGVDYLKRLYLGEVFEVDSAFRLLCSGMAKRGLLDTTSIVFTSDHGQSFGEYGQFCHGNKLHWPELHIPLIYRPAGGCDGGRIQGAVGLYDLYPSLLSTADLSVPEYVHIGPLFDGQGVRDIPWDNVTYAQDAHQNPDPDAWTPAIIGADILGTWNHDLEKIDFTKLYHPNPEAGATELNRNQLGRVEPMDKLLRETMEKIRFSRTLFSPPEYISPEDKWNPKDYQLIEDLRALGYL